MYYLKNNKKIKHRLSLGDLITIEIIKTFGSLYVVNILYYKDGVTKLFHDNLSDDNKQFHGLFSIVTINTYLNNYLNILINKHNLGVEIKIIRDQENKKIFHIYFVHNNNLHKIFYKFVPSS